MNTAQPEMDRLTELLLDEAAFGLDELEFEELESMLSEDHRTQRNEFMELAGLVQAAFLAQDQRGTDHMPGELKNRISAQRLSANAANEDNPVSESPGNVTPLVRGPAPKKPTRSITQWSGWLLAAAMALVFVLSNPAKETGTLLDPISTLAQAEDRITVTFAPGDTDPFKSAGGEVVWSGQQQAGYMRLTGLPVNDPATQQYQLWIVDPGRDANPVDGGVFNIASNGEAIIPIDAKLTIGAPAAFAITLEQPGGVVVSAGPLLLVAGVPETAS